MKHPIYTKNAPAVIGPYSQAVRVGNFVFLSGQLGIDPVTGEFAAADVAGQAEQVFKNIVAVLSEAGLNFDNVVKTVVFLADMADFTALNEVYAKYFKSPYPARSAVAVKALPKGGLVEIEVIAAE
ncbi:MAG: RidA family protein [Dysgonamonadaceae bacterium]|jgi:2-iminobutanoate/2-iminopropanoate deaminase|nr:RidA family protein [Dysgonamonadaceae bacterium]